MVPPLFEADLQLPLSDTDEKVRYPILLTVEVRAALLIGSSRLLQVHSTNPFLPGSHLPRLSEKELNRVLLLLIDLHYLVKNKQGPPSKKDGKPVVPPSLAKNQLTLPILKQNLLNIFLFFSMRFSPKPTDPTGRFGLRLEVHSLIRLH